MTRKRDELVLAAVSGRQPNGKGRIRANCPFCELRVGKVDRKQCLELRVEIGSWHCYRCGSGGLLHTNEDELAELASRARSGPGADGDEIVITAPEGFVPVYDPEHDFDLLASCARDYVRGRGIPDGVAREARIGAVFEGRLRGRVVVPILDAGGSVWLGWSARSWRKDAFRKYLYPPGMRRAQILYNHRALHERTDRPVYVVEGVFDALALWPDAVAVLGKPSHEQREALLAAPRPVVVCLDGDAWRDGAALAARLRFDGQRAGSVRLPPGLDPDEMPRAALDQLAAAALGCEEVIDGT